MTPQEAIRLQTRLATQVRLHSPRRPFCLVAGADIALGSDSGVGWAGVIVYRLPHLVEVERCSARGKIRFPYIPGLLAFREVGLLLKAFAKLKNRPDLIFVDGQGIAHPRRCGLASHLGIILKIPTIGCAKSRLVGCYKEPGQERGNSSPLVYNDTIVGQVLRTRSGVRPIFVSPGHLIDMKSAMRLVLACTDGYRIPKPTRAADHYVEELKRSAASSSLQGKTEGS